MAAVRQKFLDGFQLRLFIGRQSAAGFLRLQICHDLVGRFLHFGCLIFSGETFKVRRREIQRF